MKMIFKLSVALSLVLSTFGLSVPAAFAAAPGNDLFSGATVVPSIPFSDSVNTTEATTDADDAQLNTFCGAPATDASVWYAIQGTDSTVVVDVSASDYSAGVLVGTGTQGSLDLVTCGPGAVAFFAAAGTTYYILAIDDQLNGDGLNGGTLNLSMFEIVSPTIDTFTVNRYGRVNTRTGVATISGTYSCSHADFIDVFVDARQPVGRFTILGSGEFFDFNTCDGEIHQWSAQVFPDNGKFAGGKTLTLNFATSCGPLECAFGFAEQRVQLRGGK